MELIILNKQYDLVLNCYEKAIKLGGTRGRVFNIKVDVVFALN